MQVISKAWDWNKKVEELWLEPSEDSFYILDRWSKKGFKKFLDLGCGRGRHSIQFAKAGFDVCSLDLSEIAVIGLNKWAQEEKLTITAICGDMMKLPYEDNTFDCLLAYHVISHTDTKGIVKIISEISRVLKDGGEFYVTICSKNSFNYKDAGYPKLDENTVIKTEDGPEKNVPHFHADSDSVKELLKDYKVISLRHAQDIMVGGQGQNTWHYFALGKK